MSGQGLTACIETDWPRDSKGYGKARRAGRNWSAHRYAWTMANGPIPAGLVVCHACDNPPCINVEHLWLGTPSQNTLDRHAKGRDATGDRNGSRTRPDRRPRGPSMRHPIPGSRNGMARFTEDQIATIRARRAAGEMTKPLAREYGVNRTTIQRIVRGASWTHV